MNEWIYKWHAYIKNEQINTNKKERKKQTNKYTKKKETNKQMHMHTNKLFYYYCYLFVK